MSVVSIDSVKAEGHAGLLPCVRYKLEASLAHEINNPLESLLDLLYLAEIDPALTEGVRRNLALAREEAQRISQIVRAAMQRSRDSEERKDSNISSLLSSVVDFYRSRFENRGISLHTRYGSESEIAVYDAPLRQTMSFLLLNASDATPNGGNVYVRVSMAHEWSAQKRNGIRVTVADNGCGINADNMPRIGEPFFTTKGSAGNGIGLAFVKDTVKKHSGVLRIRSSTRPGRSGSVFTIFLPFWSRTAKALQNSGR
jgi:signal transduction histidine kinase